MTQQELESFLWGAAVILRGLVDAGDYKQFVFPLLFFKRLSDIWDEDYAKALAESSDPAYALATANDRFAVPEEAHWNDVRATAKDVGRALQQAMRATEAANPGRLDGIFGDAQWTNKERLPDATLKNLLEHLSSHTLSLANVPEDELGNGYEFLIKKFADDSGHTAQEFYTNRTVVHLMVQMLDPKPGERIYDPTCGTGGMLISALSEVKRKRGEHRTLKLFGQERNHMTASIARMNLVLHGVEDSEIARGDTLAAPAFVENDRLRTFDVVLANPPYSIKQWNREAWSSDPWGRNFLGTPPQGCADLVFVQHIISSMSAKHGRSVTLLPHGFLNRQSETGIRSALVKSDRIDAVIGLGRRLFYNSGMESCLLVCRSSKPSVRSGKILFIDASDRVERDGDHNRLTQVDIGRIVASYIAFVDEPGFSRVASIGEIERNDWSLGIKYYTAMSSASLPASSMSLADAWEVFEREGIDFWGRMDLVEKAADTLLQRGRK